MNDDFNNQNNNWGYNPSGNIGNNTYYHNTNNTTIVNTNPNAHKSDVQVEEEIEMLQKKIENNKSKMNMVNEETKVIIENIIVEDKIRLNELEHELAYRKNLLIISLILLFIVLFIGIILALLFISGGA